MKVEVLHTQQQIEQGLAELAQRIAQEELSRGVGIIAFHVIFDGGMYVAEFLRRKVLLHDLSIWVTSTNTRKYTGSVAQNDVEVRPNLTERDISQLQSNPDVTIFVIDEISDTGDSSKAVEKKLRDLHISNKIKHVALYSRETGPDKQHPDYFVFRVESTLFLLGWGLDYNNQGGEELFVAQLILDSPDEVIDEKELRCLLLELRKTQRN